MKREQGEPHSLQRGNIVTQYFNNGIVKLIFKNFPIIC